MTLKRQAHASTHNTAALCIHAELLELCLTAALQVKQSQEHLLERLISYVHNLEPTQLEHLLEEDQEVTQKRAAAQMSLQVGSGTAGLLPDHSSVLAGACMSDCRDFVVLKA